MGVDLVGQRDHPGRSTQLADASDEKSEGKEGEGSGKRGRRARTDSYLLP